MSRGTRLLHMISSIDPQKGGPSEGTRQLSVALRRLGVDSEVVVLDDPQDDWLKNYPAELHALGPSSATYQIAPRLDPWLRDNASRFDAIVVHGIWQLPGRAVRRAFKACGVPYLVYPHGMLDPWFKQTHQIKHLKKMLYWAFFEHKVLRDAAAVLFTTEHERRLAATAFPIGDCRSLVVGYGIEAPSRLRDGQKKAFLARHPECVGRKNLLFMSRLHPKKGCDILIEGFAANAKHDPALHLIIAGPDESNMRAGLEALAFRLGVAERISWTGMLSGDEKWGALQQADAFILTSHQENFGVVVVEALAVGTPVLISTQVNISDVVERFGAGLVEEDTAEGATRLIDRWLNLHLRERDRMSENARACFELNFHIDAAAHKLLDAVEAAAASAALISTRAVKSYAVES